MHDTLTFHAADNLLFLPRKVVVVLQVEQHSRTEVLRDVSVDAGSPIIVQGDVIDVHIPLPIQRAALTRVRLAAAPANWLLFSKILGHRFRAGTDVQFFVNIADVGVHRAQHDAQLGGNFLGAMAFGQQPQHFFFAGR